MNIIAPAALADIKNREYQANGKVVRVFDTNGYGALLPVEFKQQGNDSKFTLSNFPHGRIWAETVAEQSLEVGRIESGTEAALGNENVIYGLDQLPEIDPHAHLAKDAFFAIHRDRTVGIYVSSVGGHLRLPSKDIGAAVIALRDAELVSAKLEGRQPSKFATLLEQL